MRDGTSTKKSERKSMKAKERKQNERISNNERKYNVLLFLLIVI